ncbi:aminotransferase class V-fold PLP-dependent enzyme, partial [Stenotrophomonas sp. A3_2]|uniref:aminotransferase class V-fold PLP-dependent enzyme n=1 Tax=Stenotrophomonas sp. A3_2 TaxID=3119978 RepID=UPI002FC37272
HGALLHVDAVQAVGRVPVDLAALGADSLTVSGHKLGGIKGAGALALRPGLSFAPLILGGGQERGRRGGTPALPAIAALRDGMEAGAVGLGAVPLGDRAARLPNTTCLALPGVPAETQVIALDRAGVC